MAEITSPVPVWTHVDIFFAKVAQKTPIPQKFVTTTTYRENSRWNLWKENLTSCVSAANYIKPSWNFAYGNLAQNVYAYIYVYVYIALKLPYSKSIVYHIASGISVQ
jgi:hypothetical protein